MAPTEPHFSDRELIAAAEGVLSADRRRHLEHCDQCLANFEVVASDAFEQVSTPAPLVGHDIPVDGNVIPARGELWRVLHADVAELAVVWSEPRPWIRVFPATTDSDYSDERTLIVDAVDNSLDLELAIWVGMGFDLPRNIFDRTLGHLSHHAVDAIKLIHQARGEPVSGIRVGAPITSRLDDRFEYRSELTGRFATLADSILVDEEEAPDRYAPGAVDASLRRNRRLPR